MHFILQSRSSTRSFQATGKHVMCFSLIYIILMKSQNQSNQYSEKIATLTSFKVIYSSPAVVSITLIPQLGSEGKNVAFIHNLCLTSSRPEGLSDVWTESE